MGEFGPGSPPKRSRSEMLNADKVCQATAGPWGAEQFEQPERYFQGGDEALKGEERSRVRKSLVTGAEEYAKELYWSVRPPWMYRVF